MVTSSTCGGVTVSTTFCLSANRKTETVSGIFVICGEYVRCGPVKSWKVRFTVRFLNSPAVDMNVSFQQTCFLFVAL